MKNVPMYYSRSPTVNSERAWIMKRSILHSHRPSVNLIIIRSNYKMLLLILWSIWLLRYITSMIVKYSERRISSTCCGPLWSWEDSGDVARRGCRCKIDEQGTTIELSSGCKEDYFFTFSNNKNLFFTSKKYNPAYWQHHVMYNFFFKLDSMSGWLCNCSNSTRTLLQNGETPLDLAQQMGYDQIVDLLKKRRRFF